jgi:hypothetical protein
MSKKKKRELTIHPDGAIIRLHNRRIILTDRDGGFEIEFQNANKGHYIGKPNVLFKHKRGISYTMISLSNEAIEALVYAYAYLQSHRKNKNK